MIATSAMPRARRAAAVLAVGAGLAAATAAPADAAPPQRLPGEDVAGCTSVLTNPSDARRNPNGFPPLVAFRRVGAVLVALCPSANIVVP